MEIRELLRKRKGNRSWDALKNELGVSRQTLYNAMNGVHQPSDKLLKALGLRRVERLIKVG